MRIRVVDATNDFFWGSCDCPKITKNNMNNSTPSCWANSVMGHLGGLTSANGNYLKKLSRLMDDCQFIQI